MKILITGAQGQVGKELVSIANQRGFDVIAAGQTELDITQSQQPSTKIPLNDQRIQC